MSLASGVIVQLGAQYDAGAYVASVASSLVHNMTLELNYVVSVALVKPGAQYDAGAYVASLLL